MIGASFGDRKLNGRGVVCGRHIIIEVITNKEGALVPAFVTVEHRIYRTACSRDIGFAIGSGIKVVPKSPGLTLCHIRDTEVYDILGLERVLDFPQ